MEMLAHFDTWCVKDKLKKNEGPHFLMPRAQMALEIFRFISTPGN